jgi:hypothetical protein
MNKSVFAIALFLIVPAAHAQQAETSGNPSQTAPQPAPQQATQGTNAQDNLPASLRPGHPLDPADVDVLTGKRDGEREASQGSAVPISVEMYGTYRDPYSMQGRFGRAFDIPMLPLARINNPFFFFAMQTRGVGRGVFRGRR